MHRPKNPKYEIIVTEDGRRQKLKRPLPPGLSDHDLSVLRTIRRKAWRYEWLVDCHCCCNMHIQFGTVTLWGLLPVVGDFIALANALTLIRAARKVDYGLPVSLLMTMMLWAAVDFAIKLIPIVGDILTAIIKPNTRNLMRVEAFLRKRGERHLRDTGRGGSVSAGSASASVRTPLVVSAQPQVQRGMDVTAAAAPRDGAVYGTIGAALPQEQQSGEAQARQSRRLVLPFFKRNEDSDSEDEVARRR